VSREQKIAKARKLREQGLTYDAIGERLGVSDTTAYKWLNLERAKEYIRRDIANPARRKYKTEWERNNRAECPSCGAPLGSGSRCPSKRPDLCADCVRDQARSRTVRFIELRKQGMTNGEIAEREGLPRGSNVVAVAFYRAHRYGLTVPRSPYFDRFRDRKATA
jgi:transcriptional regulator with XRE-family HTH domain